MSGSGNRAEGDRGGERYSLAALTAAAGVSVRTVRYYISEGLLPPPVGAGPASHYTTAHLNRLTLIGRLKDAYLPLKEIRRRITGLSDAEVAALLDEGAEPAAPASAEADDALAYIDRVLSPTSVGAAADATTRRRREGSGAGGESRSAPPTRAAKAIREASPPWEATVARPNLPPPVVAETGIEAEAIDHGEPWLRIRLGDEAELLVSDRLLRRRRDKLDWLVRWARRVFR